MTLDFNYTLTENPTYSMFHEQYPVVKIFIQSLNLPCYNSSITISFGADRIDRLYRRALMCFRTHKIISRFTRRY